LDNLLLLPYTSGREPTYLLPQAASNVHKHWRDAKIVSLSNYEQERLLISF